MHQELRHMISADRILDKVDADRFHTLLQTYVHDEEHFPDGEVVTARFARALVSYLHRSPEHLRALWRAVIPLFGNSGPDRTDLLSRRLNCSRLPSKRLNCSRLVSGLEC